MRLGKTVFVSYRGRYYDDARRLVAFLHATGACDAVVLVPPFSITADSEVLLPYEFFELMEPTIDDIADADAFVALMPGYFDSYFTQAEVLQWRRFRKKPAAWAAEPDGDRFRLTRHDLEPVSRNDKVLWAKISTQINPRLKGRGATIWGRYARNCYLLPCRHCGEHLLATKKVVEPIAKAGGALACPHCGRPIRLGELAMRGNFYRKPIVLRDAEETPMRVLGDEDLIHLLVSDDDPPQGIALVTVPGERVSSEASTLLKVFLGGAAVVAGALVLGAALMSDDD